MGARSDDELAAQRERADQRRLGVSAAKDRHEPRAGVPQRIARRAHRSAARDAQPQLARRRGSRCAPSARPGNARSRLGSSAHVTGPARVWPRCPAAPTGRPAGARRARRRRTGSRASRDHPAAALARSGCGETAPLPAPRGAQDHPPRVPDDPEEREVDEHEQQRHADVLRVREAADDDLELAAKDARERQPAERERGGENIGPVHGIAVPASVTPSTSLVS
jgi:hypothetical protein